MSICPSGTLGYSAGDHLEGSDPCPLSAAMSDEECRSPIGLDCCSCCLDLANGCDLELQPGSPVSHFRQLRDRLAFQNLNTDRLNTIMRQDSLESVVRDPCFLLNQGVCDSNMDRTMLSILLYFHSASGASVVAIDNKIEQAMDLVKNHLMYAVREEVEILKEQIKELAEKNDQLERENSLLKNLASPEQMEKFQSCVPSDALLALDNQPALVGVGGGGGGGGSLGHEQPCGLGSGSAV